MVNLQGAGVGKDFTVSSSPSSTKSSASARVTSVSDLGNVSSGPEDAGVIIEVLSRVLTQLIELNRNVTSKQQCITKFQSSYPPSISILAYLERINKHAKCSPNCFIIALIYIDRLIETRNVILSDLNVHRVLISSVMIATKVFDDEFYKNAYYAKLGGVSTQEMNSLELEFLGLLNFDFFVTLETFEKYAKELAAFVPTCPVPEPIFNSKVLVHVDQHEIGMSCTEAEGTEVNAGGEMLLGTGREGLGLSTPPPPVPTSCCENAMNYRSAHEQHLLGHLGQPSEHKQQSHHSEYNPSFEDCLDVNMSNAVVPLNYDSGYSHFDAVTPPPPLLSASMSFSCHERQQHQVHQFPPQLAPQLEYSVSNQSYFSQHRPSFQSNAGNGLRQPSPPVYFDPHRQLHGGNFYGFGGGGGGVAESYGRQKYQQHQQHQALYEMTPAGGCGHYVTPVTTPTSVADAIFSWGDSTSNCGAKGKGVVAPSLHQQHQYQESLVQSRIFVTGNCCHPGASISNHQQQSLFPQQQPQYSYGSHHSHHHVKVNRQLHHQPLQHAQYTYCQQNQQQCGAMMIQGENSGPNVPHWSSGMGY